MEARLLSKYGTEHGLVRPDHERKKEKQKPRQSTTADDYYVKQGKKSPVRSPQFNILKSLDNSGQLAFSLFQPPPKHPAPPTTPPATRSPKSDITCGSVSQNHSSHSRALLRKKDQHHSQPNKAVSRDLWPPHTAHNFHIRPCNTASLSFLHAHPRIQAISPDLATHTIPA